MRLTNLCVIYVLTQRFPVSFLPGRLHFQEQEPGDGEEESGKYGFMERGGGARCHHRQRRTCGITPNLWRDSLAVHGKTAGNPILHSAVQGNGIDASGRSQHPCGKASLGIPFSRNDTNR